MRTALLCVILLLHGHLHSQISLITPANKQPKPLLFSQLPEQFECDRTALEKLISLGTGNTATAVLSDQFRVEGKLLFKGQTEAGTFSFNIRLANYHDALFNVTLRLTANNTTVIRGRIIHPQFDDALILTQEKGKYTFKKVLQRHFMPE